MNVVDILIILFIFIGGVIGYKRGAVKELVQAVGLIVVAALAFLLKNPLSVIFYENLPFFKFGGILKGITVLNIFLYEFIAFLILFSILMLLWKLVVIASSLIQKIINATVILKLPSKIIGFVLGVVEYYIIAFVILYILILPIFNLNFIADSKCTNEILNETPVLSLTVKENMKFINEFAQLKEKYKNSNSTEFNYDTLDLFLKYDIVNIDSVKKLVEKDKIDIKGIDKLIERYSEL